MPTSHTVQQILAAAQEKIASGHGFVRDGAVLRFDATVQLGATRYHVKVDWPDGAGFDRLAPLIEDKAYTVLIRDRDGAWEPREADLTLAEAQRLAKECHLCYKDEVLIAPTTEEHRCLVAQGDCP